EFCLGACPKKLHRNFFANIWNIRAIYQPLWYPEVVPDNRHSPKRMETFIQLRLRSMVEKYLFYEQSLRQRSLSDTDADPVAPWKATTKQTTEKYSRSPRSPAVSSGRWVNGIDLPSGLKRR